MGYEDGNLAELVREVRKASLSFETGDRKTGARIDEIERLVNQLMVKSNRPGSSSWQTSDDELAERKSAAEMCVIKHNLTVPKNDGNSAEYVPSSGEIDEAITARKALKVLFRHGDPARLEQTFRKSLTSFSFSGNSFTTLVTDPFSAGWCTLYKFDCRIGAAVTCPNAVRLLKIR
jgi:hypothetical protein